LPRRGEARRTHRGYHYKDAAGRWRTPTGNRFASAKKAIAANARRRIELIRRDARAALDDALRQAGLKPLKKKTFDSRVRGKDRARLKERVKRELRFRFDKARAREAVIRRARKDPDALRTFDVGRGASERGFDVDVPSDPGKLDPKDYLDEILEDFDDWIDSDDGAGSWGDTP